MQRPRQRFPDRIAKAMVRHRAEAARSGGAGVDAAGGDHAAPAAASTEAVSNRSVPVPGANLVSVPARRADTGTVEGVVTRVTWDPGAGRLEPTAGLSPRKRPRLGRWFALACALLAGLAFMPLSRELVLPATVVSYGEEQVVSSPVGGVVAEMWIGAGDRVEPGKPLMSIQPPAPPALIEERRNWNRLKWREVAQLARLAGQAQLSRPEGLLDAGSGNDLDAAWSEQQRLLAQGLAADRTVFGPLLQSIERLEGELAEARAGTAATAKQLKTAQARLGRTAALRDRNVIYDEGVYTEQLFDTLTQMTKGLKKEIAAQEQAAAAAEAKLDEARGAMAQRKVQHTGELEAALARTREQLDVSRARITALEAETSRVEVRSDWGGIVKATDRLRVGGRVEAGEALLTLKVPGEKAVLETTVEPLGPDLVRTGQPVTVVLPSTRPGADEEYAGRVTHVAPLRRGSIGLTLEIDTPDNGRVSGADLFSGMRGEAVVPTRQRAFRYLWHWLTEQARLLGQIPGAR